VNVSGLLSVLRTHVPLIDRPSVLAVPLKYSGGWPGMLPGTVIDRCRLLSSKPWVKSVISGAPWVTLTQRPL
jgi:hypothetical protein